MWPSISNIDSNIEATIKGYANNNLEASKLNAWIRAYSGANAGLILESNTDFKLFAAAGEGNAIYGNSDRSGIIGKTWGPGYVTSGVGRALRPSPIITSFNSKEGQDQISRTCDFSITCFSLEQLEIIQTYFMEPGYSVGVEWGWNTPNSARGLINTSAGQDGILNAIADTTLNNGALSSKRTSTNGEYDIFLGFIVGSTVSNDGENFKVDVKLRGAPALPTYLQSQNRIDVKSSGVQIDEKKVKQPYSDADVLKEGLAGASAESRKLVAERRFKLMFNELPAFRQTEDVKTLLDTANMFDFINFDGVVSKKISEFIETADNNSFLGTGLFGEATIDVDFEGGSLELEKEKLFSKNRYIAFSLAVDILNKMGVIDHYQVGDKKISFKIDINKSVIGAFPNMFSTKASKLIIPGFVPNFMYAYFLTPGLIEQVNTGALIIDGKKWPPKTATSLTRKFIGQNPLNENKLKEQAYFYGYLKTLYVNFDMFKEKIQQTNKTIREILQDILNEMSSAVNSFWNFQIVEGEDTGGDIIITVVDENWIGQNPEPEGIKTFKHSGVGSPFLNASLDISIPAETANKIINDRLNTNSQPDMQNIKVGTGTLFNATTDLFLKKTRINPEEEGDQEPVEEPSPESAEYERLVSKIDTKIDNTKTETKEIAGSGGKSEYYYSVDNKLLKIVFKAEGQPTQVTYYGIGTIEGFTEAEQTRLNELQEQKNAEAASEISSRISSNIEKIDVVPVPGLTAPIEITETGLIDTVRKNFMVLCYDDTDFFDKMKNYWFETKSTMTAGGTGLSHPLPIKYSFTILGNSGIRRGDTFNIDGIPAKYKNSGLFQVTEIEHSISNMRWETNVTGQYRQIQ
jgi:hypothetical protein